MCINVVEMQHVIRESSVGICSVWVLKASVVRLCSPPKAAETQTRRSSTTMAITLTTELDDQSNYNRADEVKAFDETKLGVKGLVDSGITKVPRIFIRPPNERVRKSDSAHFQIPVIDLQGDRQTVVEGIKDAAQKWGFFQIVNHGVPLTVMDEMVRGATRFFEGDDEMKKQYYTRENKRVIYASNFDLYTSKAANWRDSFGVMTYDRSEPPLDPLELPPVCRDINIEFEKHMLKLGDALFEKLSEALGLEADHLVRMNCNKACSLYSHYYPACPEPELTMGTSKHTDSVALTFVLQDSTGGLQVLYQDHWVDVHPVPGALVVNIGDLLQIISNDKFKSVAHRVLANDGRPRVSIAFFITARGNVGTERYGPIKELISDACGPKYREFSYKEYVHNFLNQGFDGKSGLESFKL